MFKKAIDINPNHIEHYLELARTYEFMDREDLMKEPLQKVLALSNVEEKDPGFKRKPRKCSRTSSKQFTIFPRTFQLAADVLS